MWLLPWVVDGEAPVCGFPYAVQRLGHASPVLCPVRALLAYVSLGLRPWLHPLRRRFPAFVRRLLRYYAEVRLLLSFIIGYGSSPSRYGPVRLEATRPGKRSPRFRRVPFERDVALDPGRATEPRIAAPHVLPSASSTAPASALLPFRGSSPHPTRLLCTLRRGRHLPRRNTRYRAGATPYPDRTFTGWTSPAFLAHRRSVPARAWRQSGPPDPGSSECRAVARLLPASVWTLAAPDRAGTPSKPVPRAAPPATSPGPMLRSPQRSFGRCPAHPHLLGPAHRHDAGCPRGRSCRRAGRSGRQAPPSPCDTAFSEGSGSSQVLPGSSPITFTSPSSKAHQKSGPFPPPALPSFDGTMTLSDSRSRRRLSRR